MAFNRGPRIVTDGLMFYVDADNPDSYPLSGTTWFDIMGNQDIDLTLISRLPEIYFDGTNDQVFGTWPDSIIVDDNVTPRTWEVICMPDSTQTLSEIFGIRAFTGNTYSANGGLFIFNGTYHYVWYNNTSYQYLDSGVTPTVNKYAHVVGTFEADAKPRIYVNGELKATNSVSTQLNYGNGGQHYCIGFSERNGGQNFFGGYIKVIRYYVNNAFTLEDVQRHYNAYKTKYNI